MVAQLANWIRVISNCRRALSLIYFDDSVYICYVSAHTRTHSILIIYMTNAHKNIAWCFRGAFTYVGWQVTLCDPIWRVTLRSSEMGCPWRAILGFNLFLRWHTRHSDIISILYNSNSDLTIKDCLCFKLFQLFSRQLLWSFTTTTAIL